MAENTAVMAVEKHWVDGGQLFVKVKCADREKLVNGIRQFVTDFVADPENKLSAWTSAGVEKVECPQAYDPDNPDKDVVELGKAAAAQGRQIKWMFNQTVRLTRPI